MLLRDILSAFVTLAMTGCIGSDGSTPADSTTSDDSPTSESSLSSGVGDAGTNATSDADVDDSNATSSDDNVTSGTEDATSENSSSASADSTTAAEPSCEPHEYFTCTVPYDCSSPDTNCGGVNSWFDELGCMRLDCTETDECPRGMRCHHPFDQCGVCAEINNSCSDSIGNGEVICDCAGGDGACNGAFCLPEDEFPVGDCGER